MIKRKVLFTHLDGSTSTEYISLPGHVLNPPKRILHRGDLFEYKGSGIEANFYHQQEAFVVKIPIAEAAGEVH